MSKPDVLELHGTTMGGLQPLNVLQAAEEDFKRIERNAKRSSGEYWEADYEHFAFHRKHVHRSANARELIFRALREQALGTASGKKNTRLIYKDVDTLRQAYALACIEYQGLTPAEMEPEKEPEEKDVNLG